MSTRTDAPLAQWAKGFVTLTGPTTVRMPVALRPVSVAAPAEVSAEVADGSVGIDATAGFDGDLVLTTAGKAREMGVPEDKLVYLHGHSDIKDALSISMQSRFEASISFDECLL